MSSGGARSAFVTSALRRPKLQSIVSQLAYVVSIGILNVIVVRAWGATERGDLATVTIISTLAATVGGLGLSDVIVWVGGAGPAPPKVDARFRRSVVATSVSGLIGAGAATAVLRDQVGLLVPLWALSLHLFRASMSTRLGAADFTRFNLHRTALPIMTALAIAVGAALGAHVHPALWGLVGQVAAAVMFFDHRSEHLRLLGGLHGAAPGERSVARDSVIGNLAGLSLARIDVILVAVMLTSAEAGRYSVTLAVGDAAMVGSYGLMFHAMHEGARDKRVSRRTLRMSMWITIALAGLGVLALEIGADAVLGPDFSGLSTTFALLLPGIAAMSYLRLRYAGDLTAGSGWPATRALLIAIGVMIGADLLLVPALEVNGAAIGASLAYLVAAATLSNRHGQHA